MSDFTRKRDMIISKELNKKANLQVHKGKSLN